MIFFHCLLCVVSMCVKHKYIVISYLFLVVVSKGGASLAGPSGRAPHPEEPEYDSDGYAALDDIDEYNNTRSSMFESAPYRYVLVSITVL